MGFSLRVSIDESVIANKLEIFPLQFQTFLLIP